MKVYLYDPSDANKRPTDSPRANASLGATRDARRATRAAYGASPGHKAAPGISRAEQTPPCRGGAALCLIPAGAQAHARGATCARTGRGSPAPLPLGRPGRHGARRLVSTESPDSRASRRYAARASRHWQAVSARHTHPPASSRAERLRLCESHKSADRSQSRTSSSGWSSTTARRSTSRSASPVLRDPWGRRGAASRRSAGSSR